MPPPDFRFTSSTGLFPSIFNLASHAKVQANATCGQTKQEVSTTRWHPGHTPPGVLHPVRAGPQHQVRGL